MLRRSKRIAQSEAQNVPEKQNQPQNSPENQLSDQNTFITVQSATSYLFSTKRQRTTDSDWDDMIDALNPVLFNDDKELESPATLAENNVDEAFHFDWDFLNEDLSLWSDDKQEVSLLPSSPFESIQLAETPEPTACDTNDIWGKNFSCHFNRHNSNLLALFKQSALFQEMNPDHIHIFEALYINAIQKKEKILQTIWNEAKETVRRIFSDNQYSDDEKGYVFAILFTRIIMSVNFQTAIEFYQSYPNRIHLPFICFKTFFNAALISRHHGIIRFITQDILKRDPSEIERIKQLFLQSPLSKSKALNDLFSNNASAASFPNRKNLPKVYLQASSPPLTEIPDETLKAPVSSSASLFCNKKRPLPIFSPSAIEQFKSNYFNHSDNLELTEFFGNLYENSTQLKKDYAVTLWYEKIQSHPEVKEAFFSPGHTILFEDLFHHLLTIKRPKFLLDFYNAFPKPIIQEQKFKPWLDCFNSTFSYGHAALGQEMLKDKLATDPSLKELQQIEESISCHAQKNSKRIQMLSIKLLNLLEQHNHLAKDKTATPSPF